MCQFIFKEQIFFLQQAGARRLKRIFAAIISFIKCFCNFSAIVYPAPDPCLPSPCGPYSICRSETGRAICACEPGTLGAPPSCRPQCVISEDCPLALACLSGNCVNPCAGSCGFNARCVVQNHQPICSCDFGYSGDPFAGCNPIEGK